MEMETRRFERGESMNYISTHPRLLFFFFMHVKLYLNSIYSSTTTNIKIGIRENDIEGKQTYTRLFHTVINKRLFRYCNLILLEQI